VFYIETREVKKAIYKLYNKVGIDSQRTRNITNHIGLSVIYKAGSIVANFMLVPIAINYLGNEKYGVWLTLSSFIGWFSVFDIGLGNGLRNKLTEARTVGNKKLEKAYVSTAYYTIGVISTVIVTIFIIVNHFINWATLFNTKPELQNQLKILMPLVFAFFGIQLLVKLIAIIYIADRDYSIQGKIQFITQTVLLLILWIITKISTGTLLFFGAAFSAVPVIVLFLFNIIAFSKRFNDIKPNIKFCKRKYLKDIMGLGLKFFIIQIAALVLFSTDNLIISKLFTPAEVVPYNIAYKYFSIATIIYTLIVTPYWSAFTEAYTKKDFSWIKSSVKNIQKIWLFIPLLLGFMLLISGWFYNFWVGDKVNVPLSLSLAMALFVLLMTYNMIYVYFINGVGKIRIQLIISIVVMIVNVPLSILFASIFKWGIAGVIFASTICLTASVILFPMQYNKIINNRAEGIWNN